MEGFVIELEGRLSELGVDLVVSRPGNAGRVIELHVFSGKDFASFRANWTDAAGVTLKTFAAVDFNSDSLRDCAADQVQTILGP